ncbi:hypothetical protein MIMGU_mgv1a026808mg [Erythranthe guttata]|uniref:Uncharacterized protein n=1 Tax=Erythranthe guttata TaxID=4155 RepID=A0A022RK30_ERYGU|nr:hypothetical protein MIMGU_mgv1a026808mg [Erythranthe guttata]
MCKCRSRGRIGQIVCRWVDNRKKISREIYEDRIRSQEASRCFTTNHKFHVGRSMNTGNYDQRFLYQPPSTSEIPTETFF